MNGITKAEGVHVDEEDDADEDVGVVNFSEDGHEPGLLVQDVLLDGQLDGNVETLFEGENGDGVAFGTGEDGFIAADEGRRQGSCQLVHPVREVPVPLRGSASENTEKTRTV